MWWQLTVRVSDCDIFFERIERLGISSSLTLHCHSLSGAPMCHAFRPLQNRYYHLGFFNSVGKSYSFTTLGSESQLSDTVSNQLSITDLPADDQDAPATDHPVPRIDRRIPGCEYRNLRL